MAWCWETQRQKLIFTAIRIIAMATVIITLFRPVHLTTVAKALSPKIE
jgi:hypothetical protein